MNPIEITIKKESHTLAFVAAICIVVNLALLVINSLRLTPPNPKRKKKV
jgi:hypothetical protein